MSRLAGSEEGKAWIEPAPRWPGPPGTRDPGARGRPERVTMVSDLPDYTLALAWPQEGRQK
jgi:hypothetical protein